MSIGDTSLGKVLVGAKGMTLYMYTKDTNGESVCYDKCAVAWPPLLTTGDPKAGDGVDAKLLSTTTRKDGARQVVYKGMPLYYFAKDKAAGDVVGQDVGKVWYVVAPDGKVIGLADSTAQAGAAGTTVSIGDTSLGKILVGAKGMTLYMYTKDTNGESVCYDKCAVAWPPLLTTGDPKAGDGVVAKLLSTTTRKDGARQVVYKGMPLYYFAKDQTAGDVVGQDVGKVWYVVAPSGEIVQ